MKIKSSISLDGNLNQVLSKFVITDDWKVWYGGAITSVEPAWQKDAVVNWELGMPSKIIEFDIPNIISLKSDNGLITNYLFLEKSNNNVEFSIEKDFSASSISVTERSQVENQINDELKSFKSYFEKNREGTNPVNNGIKEDKPSQANTGSINSNQQLSENINNHVNSNELNKQFGWLIFYLVIFFVLLILVLSGPIKIYYVAGLIAVLFMAIGSLRSYVRLKKVADNLDVTGSRGKNETIDKGQVLLNMQDPSREVNERQWNIAHVGSIIAKRLYYDGETVTIKKTDGSHVNYSLSQLSADDRSYLVSTGINRIPGLTGTWKNNEGNIAEYELNGICKLDNDTYYYTIKNSDLVLFTKDSILTFKIKVEINKMTTIYESINKPIEWLKISAVNDTQVTDQGGQVVPGKSEKYDPDNQNLEIIVLGVFVTGEQEIFVNIDGSNVAGSTFSAGMKTMVAIPQGSHKTYIINKTGVRLSKVTDFNIEDGKKYQIEFEYTRAWGRYNATFIQKNVRK